MMAVTSAKPAALPATPPFNLHLVLFSVADDLRYNRHIASIMALPDGFSYKCRYLKSWVQEGVSLEELSPRATHFWIGPLPGLAPVMAKLWPERTRRTPGVFVAITKNADGEVLFIPVRLFKVLAVYDYGKIVFFEIELGRLIDFRDPQHTVATVSDAIRSQTYADSDHETLKKEVFVIQGDFAWMPVCVRDTLEENRRAWANAAETLVSNNVLTGVSFLQVNLRQLGRRKGLRPEQISPEQVGVWFRPGVSYLIDIFQYRPTPERKTALEALGVATQAFIERNYATESSMNPAVVTVECDESLLQIVKRDEVVDGDFDRFQLILRASGRSVNETTIIRIRDSQQVIGVSMPIVEIPVLIKNSRLRTLTNYFVLILGVVGFVIPSILQSWLPRIIEPVIPDSVLYRFPVYGPLSDSTIQALSVIGLLMVLANWNLGSFVQELKGTLKLH